MTDETTPLSITTDVIAAFGISKGNPEWSDVQHANGKSARYIAECVIGTLLAEGYALVKICR